jgi:hypothetical protein
MTITSDQAVDIAINLCGAKIRNEFSAGVDAQAESNRGSNQADCGMDKEGVNEGEDEDYFYDLVQMMSLLIIPELLQLSEQFQSMKAFQHVDKGREPFTFDLSKPLSFLSDDVATVRKGSANLSPQAAGIIQVVIESLTEIFDDDLRNDIRRGLPLDAYLLRKILQSFGDFDAANDPQRVQQMLVSRFLLGHGP